MNLQGLILREARREEHAALLAFEQKVIAAERPFNPALKERDAYYYDIEALILSPDSRLVVGEIAGAIVATGYLQIRQSKASLKHERHGYLGFMYVAEQCRGLGVNRLILQDLVRWGERQGIADFYLDVYADNISAVRAYEKFGFQGSVLEMKRSLD